MNPFLDLSETQQEELSFWTPKQIYNCGYEQGKHDSYVIIQELNRTLLAYKRYVDGNDE